LPGVVNLGKLGALPIKNYTTNVYPGGDEQLERYAAPAIRALFPHRGHQCSACGMHHCHQSVITDGPHAGEIVDEPEYEGFSGCGAAIGCTDPVGAAWLNTRVDRAGVDVNEFGWVCGLAMEGYEKGWLTKEELGFELPWGDAQAADRLLRLICQRHGIGNLLAEGVKRFCEAKGEPWYSAGVFTQKGAAPRGHDHRARWEEMLDTCVSSTGTLGTGPLFHPVELGVPARRNPFDPEDTAHAVATGLGRRDFDDSIGACIFTTRVSMELVAQAVNATTGADLHLPDALAIGRRIAHLFRAFNLRCGVHGPDLEKPSPRYWSTPVDGPVAGTDIKPHWDRMVARYYELVGWDRASGRPTPETLRQYGLEDVLRDLWGEQVVAR
ncbi:MAG: aldehyde ferredoxin oxidoreductase C-terminal domain-containing protein, partial [Chloroflexi bacterium]|nr:aldehyde ferredoxin oxidoreductase C-terminal domain-containing protein [Chloroflexota bacterium]